MKTKKRGKSSRKLLFRLAALFFPANHSLPPPLPSPIPRCSPSLLLNGLRFVLHTRFGHAAAAAASPCSPRRISMGEETKAQGNTPPPLPLPSRPPTSLAHTKRGRRRRRRRGERREKKGAEMAPHVQRVFGASPWCCWQTPFFGAVRLPTRPPVPPDLPSP